MSVTGTGGGNGTSGFNIGVFAGPGGTISAGGNGTVVVTGQADWGGWRVPMSEYDRDPQRVEHQSRVFANALRLMRVARELIEFAQDYPHETPGQLQDLAKQAEMVLAAVYHEPASRMDAAVAAE